MNKPPIGLTPRVIWEEQRKMDVYNAIARYLVDGKQIPIEWVEEYNELVSKGNE